MKPELLKISGFLSYSEPTAIDFSELETAAILGANGAGKTSLVEALGWCLFGQGRGKGRDEFISTGETECKVALAFELGGTTYLVEREVRRGKGTTLSLFSVVDESVTPIGGANITETQTEIERLLGMDYATWTATSFVGQNQADAFTRMRPAERKQLLFDVLGLDEFEDIAAAAREEAKKHDASATTLKARMDQAEAQRPTFQVGPEQDQRRIDEELASAEAAVDQARAAYDEAMAEKVKYRSAAGSVDEIREQMAELTRSHEVMVAAADTEVNRLRDEVDAAQRDARRLRTELEELHTFGEQAKTLRTQRETQRASQDDLTRQRDKAATDAGAQEAIATAARAHVAEFERRMQEAQEALRPLTHHDGGAKCPTCTQELSVDLRATVTGALRLTISTNETDAMNERIQAERAEEAALTGWKTVEGLQRDVSLYAGRIEDTTARLSKAEASYARVPEVRSQLANVERAIEALDAAYAEAIRARAEVTEPPQIAVLAAKLAGAQAHASHLNSVEVAAEQATARLREAEAIAGRCIREQALVRQAVKNDAGIDRDLATFRVDRDFAEARAHDYTTLGWAFGRDGIPTLILENAIPQIEAVANDFLERITAGRLRCHLESQVANKSGGIKETLEILVSDDSAARTIEELSGGERQMVDLAVRIGLSQLLAHRAGRQIQTLILDEAFTALDAQHRQRAIDILEALRGDFDLVLFVTHLDELAQAIGSRIEVSRSGGSSTVKVVA